MSLILDIKIPVVDLKLLLYLLLNKILVM